MTRLADLRAVVGEAESLVIVCHDNPDPDSIASALGLGHLADHWGVPTVEIVYGGVITHQQNRAFVNLLDLDLAALDSVDLATFDCVTFVDHAEPGANNSVPEGTEVDVVIDHHTTADPPAGALVDLREDCGATASIVVSYLEESDVEITEQLAAALLFAVHRERLDYVRRPTVTEYRVALTLFPKADVPLVEQLYSAAFTPSTLDAIGEAIRTRETRGSTLVATVGRTAEGGAIPQAADYLLNLEGVRTVLVYGIVEGSVRLSARSNDSRVDVTEELTEAFGDVGQIGGHDDMAGGGISLGLFAESGEESQLLSVLSRRISRRFFDAMGLEAE